MSTVAQLSTWVDRHWIGGGNHRILLIPTFIFGVPGLLVGQDFILIASICLALAVVWNAFIAWRWWVVMKQASAEADRKYDRTGKFRLAREYWNTESATAALNRKKKKHD